VDRTLVLAVVNVLAVTMMATVTPGAMAMPASAVGRRRTMTRVSGSGCRGGQNRAGSTENA